MLENYERIHYAVLHQYRPAVELEKRVSMEFIGTVQEKLQKRTDEQAQSKLIYFLDTTFNFAECFPFSPYSIKFQDVDIPRVLNLPMLKKI